MTQVVHDVESGLVTCTVGIAARCATFLATARSFGSVCGLIVFIVEYEIVNAGSSRNDSRSSLRRMGDKPADIVARCWRSATRSAGKPVPAWRPIWEFTPAATRFCGSLAERPLNRLIM